MRGKVGDLGQSAAQTGDHPRVCGEKAYKSMLFKRFGKSPPRMRGKGLAVLIGARGAGITPAYAGKSQGLADIYEVLGDHPRVCGEKFWFVYQIFIF